MWFPISNHQWKVQAQLSKLTVAVPQGNQPLSWFQWISEWVNLQLKLGLEIMVLYLKWSGFRSHFPSNSTRDEGSGFHDEWQMEKATRLP